MAKPEIGKWYRYKEGLYQVLDIEPVLIQDPWGKWVSTVKYRSPTSAKPFYRSVTEFTEKFVAEGVTQSTPSSEPPR